MPGLVRARIESGRTAPALCTNEQIHSTVDPRPQGDVPQRRQTPDYSYCARSGWTLLLCAALAHIKRGPLVSIQPSATSRVASHNKVGNFPHSWPGCAASHPSLFKQSPGSGSGSVNRSPISLPARGRDHGDDRRPTDLQLRPIIHSYVLYLLFDRPIFHSCWPPVPRRLPTPATQPTKCPRDAPHRPSDLKCLLPPHRCRRLLHPSCLCALQLWLRVPRWPSSARRGSHAAALSTAACGVPTGAPGLRTARTGSARTIIVPGHRVQTGAFGEP